MSPQQRVELLERRINDLDKQIKASKAPSTADLKEIATLEKGRIDSENTIRTGLFQAVGGLLVFVTLYISWLTLKANEAKQVAERFSKAVEQLGNDNIHVRLGGIYALEQVAKDAEEKYYWQVMETLTSYVRERSPNPEKVTQRHSSGQAVFEPITSNETSSDEEIPPLPVDIQAVMTVLARRKHSYGHSLERDPLNLESTDLRSLLLNPGSRLQKANFYRAKLQGAILNEADLQGAEFSFADLRSAHIYKANLREATLNQAKLQGATIDRVYMESARFRGANLQDAILPGTDLRDANFYLADLQRARFGKAKMRGAKLEKADLSETSLYEVVDLTWEQLDEAASYEGAILPDYLPPRAPQVETARSTNQATESVQAEGEIAATQPEEPPLAPPES